MYEMSVHIQIIRATGEELVNTQLLLHALNLELYKLVEDHFTVTALFDHGKLLDSTKRVEKDMCLVAHEASAQSYGSVPDIYIRYILFHKIYIIQPTRSIYPYKAVRLLATHDLSLLVGTSSSALCDDVVRLKSAKETLVRCFFLGGAGCVDKLGNSWKLTADAFVK